ncbi:MAG: hypothetical protein FRX49_11029 [Trebouxia sp. A1-2]|nr:MAG: hypothetical protein FRX49_11029 [Trebouxia sp. A1-2]
MAGQGIELSWWVSLELMCQPTESSDTAQGGTVLQQAASAKQDGTSQCGTRFADNFPDNIAVLNQAVPTQLLKANAQLDSYQNLAHSP